MAPFHWTLLAFFLLLTLGLLPLALGFSFLPVRVVFALVLAVFLLFIIILVIGVSCLSCQFFGPAFCHNRAAGKKVALTFDDGPDPRCTTQLLDLLAREKCKAAFFVTGSRAKQYPDLLRRMVEDGHIVGNHTMYHRSWTNFLLYKALFKEIEAASTAISSACGKKCRYFRPPVGLSNNILFRVLKKQELICIGFSNGRYDRAAKSGMELAARIIAHLKEGDIIILHDSTRDTQVLLDAVSKLLSELKAAGYQVVGLDELIGQAAYFT